ncbi:MAG: hypothetical protein KKG49_16375 [Gammaproteobacteria bacterium]|uniref:hypothetical protein n=1 Tax=Hydrogenophaga sp. TaxID=1904254 RepID=UPI0025C66875|nr:hypothetical protein [Hydrogenophaga sp.]MBU4281089.1 hypothetical protein [Gammaproteobacteria bacterium]MBU4324805.1 hypothetical protein [Gammaproteobacteria bacterium]MBU4506704.1 hypothetical protein [Gammaproteobacteria bacterium]MCG2657688.1 hypothetical protein [Hydrogenophaga sp.]
MYRIEEFSEIWADACLRNSDGRLMFLSYYGRDGSVMQFLASLELGHTERGLNRFHLVGADGQRHPVEVSGTERLGKHAARLPRQNLFGPLTHNWIYDKTLQSPDRANRIAWVMHRPGDAARCAPNEVNTLYDKAWQVMSDLSPVALLDHWREPCLDWCREKRAVELLDDPVYPALGQVMAMRVSLSDHFVQFVSDGVRSGLLEA